MNNKLTDEREAVRAAHAAWSDKAFGSVGPIGPLKHLSREALEAAAEPGDLSEWADMQFLLWDAQRRAGITDEQITRAMMDKLAVNRARQWPEPKDGEPRLHIKEQSAPVVPDERAAFNAWNNEDNLPIAGVGAKNAAWLAWQARASLCGNSALNVPPERPADSSNGDDVEAWFDEGWNACRAAMLQAGNSPVSPGGWISCSERMPNDKQYVWCWGKSYGWTEYDTFEGYYDWSRNKWWTVTDDGEEPASKVTHWMPLPEPPQEVK
ncbi:TPA: DUF550 domain-containing protein [Salmonella enterica subsp. salamae serovar 51:c:-]|nr:DUF550 domain-containing protein [Salmonella enterica subsp. salamae serovar 51:c:-]